MKLRVKMEKEKDFW